MDILKSARIRPGFFLTPASIPLVNENEEQNKQATGKYESFPEIKTETDG